MLVTITIFAIAAFASEADGKSLPLLSCPGRGGKFWSCWGGGDGSLCKVPPRWHQHICTQAKAGGKNAPKFRQHLKAAERHERLKPFSASQRWCRVACPWGPKVSLFVEKVSSASQGQICGCRLFALHTPRRGYYVCKVKSKAAAL